MWTEEQFWGNVDIRGPDECWPWQLGKFTYGYGKLAWRGNAAEVAHRVAYTLAKGPIPPGLDVMHSCDNPPCCNPKHLSPGTKRANQVDALQKGLLSNVKLTEQIVREARRLHRVGGVSYSALGRRYGVTTQGIRHAILGISWGHIPQEE